MYLKELETKIKAFHSFNHSTSIKNQPRKVLVQWRPLVRNTFDPNTC